MAMNVQHSSLRYSLRYLVGLLLVAGAQAKGSLGRRSEYPLEKYYTCKAQSPHVEFTLQTPECDDGRQYLITPRGPKVPDPGPMILNANGDLVWMKHFKNDFGGQAYDLKVQRYQDEDYLTFWLGDDRVRGHGAGHFYMLNSSYDVVHKIGASKSLYADLHEFIITPEGTALLLIFEPAPADLKPLGRKFNDLWNQAIWDCVLQEVEIESGKLMFEWRASEHLNLNSTYSHLISIGDAGTKVNPFDWFHANSVQKDELGNYLISARNVHGIYYINGKSKNTIWTLGGRNNMFQDLSGGNALNFAWQHDARVVEPSAFPELYDKAPAQDGWTTRLMTMFDNAALDWDYSYGPQSSRGVLLELTYPTPGSEGAQRQEQRLGKIKSIDSKRPLLSDQDEEKISDINGTNPNYTVRVVKEYVHPQSIISSTQGSVQLLPRSSDSQKGGPHVFVGYGINAVMTEYSSNGTAVCDLRFAAPSSWETGNVQSYRAYKQKWVGRPRHGPAAVVRRNTVYVSWNGATEHAAWQLQAAMGNEDIWIDLVRANKTGFETAISLAEVTLARSQNRLRVVALDAQGNICPHGISGVMRRGFLASIPRPSDLNLQTSDPLLWLIGAAVAALVLVPIYRRVVSARRRRARRALLPRQRVD